MAQELIQVDVAKVIDERLPKVSRYLPRALKRWVARLVCQDEINTLLRAIYPAQGVEAASRALHELGITLDVEGEENIPPEGRFIFAANHPLGGLDGLALISLIGERYRGEIKFLVNDLLMAITPLKPVFLPVNKYGTQSRAGAAEIETEYDGSKQMITFPAGLCSRLNASGLVRDLEWKKFFVTRAARCRRDIIPVRVVAQNSRKFYRLARLRKRIGIKFNYEMLLLPSEMFAARGAQFKIVIGKPVSCDALDVSNAHREAQRIKDIVYRLDEN